MPSEVVLKVCKSLWGRPLNLDEVLLFLSQCLFMRWEKLTTLPTPSPALVTLHIIAWLL